MSDQLDHDLETGEDKSLVGCDSHVPNIGVDFQLIDTYFEDGPLGVTLRRRAEDGIVFVFDVVASSQAVNLDVEVGDELWGVAETEIGNTPLDKDAWNGLIQFIKQSRRPLRMIWRRYNVMHTHEMMASVPNEQVTDIPAHSTNYLELQKIVNRLVVKENNTKKSAAVQKDFDELLREGRCILKVGDFSSLSSSKTTIWTKTAHIKRHLILLSDLLLICSPQVGNMFQVEEIIDLQTCKLRSDGQKFGGDSSLTCSKDPNLMFEVLYPGGIFELLADSVESKEVWVLQIYLAICDCVGEAERVLGWRHQYMLGTMHSAVLLRDEVRVKELVSLCEAGQMEFSVIESPDADGYTPLHYAIMLRIHNIVKILHEASADVTAADNLGLSCIHWAAMKLDDYALSLLCAHIFDVDLLDHFDRTPLYMACVEGRDTTGKTDTLALTRCVTVLLAHQPNVMQIDQYGITLLHNLAASWQYETMDLLLNAGADALSGNIHNMTPLHFASCACPIKKVVGEAHKIINRMNNSDPELLVTEELNRLQGANTLRSLLRHGGRPNGKDKLGRASLHILAETKHEQNWGPTELCEAVSVLISFGARMDESPILVEFRNKYPDISYAALSEKWMSLPVINGDKLNVTIGQFGRGAEIHSPSVDNKAAKEKDIHSSSGGCALCSFQFTMFKRQHHCRFCSLICCDECSKKRIIVDSVTTRTCDSCYNRVLYMQEQALQKELLNSIKPLPRCTEVKYTGNVTEMQQQNEENRQDLFCTNTSNSVTQGGTDARRKCSETSGRNRNSSGLNATMNTLSETHNRLQERGEKLSRLSDRTEEISNQASEFAKMAKQLNEQQKNRWF